MLDLGSSFVASVARDPNAIAIVDGELRLTYRQWFAKISSLVASFDRVGLRAGDRVVTMLQNRWEAATLHWACQLAGIVITPFNWRAKADELDYCIENSEARAIFYQDVSAEAAGASLRIGGLPQISVGLRVAEAIAFADLVEGRRSCSIPQVRRLVRKACRDVTASSVRRRSHMSHKISMAVASAPSASCRFITPWAFARCLRCR
jgi:2-furoate---CoA ligase